MNKKLVLFGLVGFLAGCTVDAEFDGNSPTVYVCTDLRDGEVYTFKTENIIKMKKGYFGAHDSMTFVDNEGQRRHWNRPMEAFIKCEPGDKE